LEKEQKKKERFLQYQEKYCSKKPVYSNCSIESPDGLKLCNCDEKKIHWYLQRELADLVTEKPLVIRLRFLPGGKGHSELEEEVKKENFYYVTERENICVICGNDKNYLKFHIVPLLYRRHFPNRFKSHRSHDVLLICTTCHEKANQAIDKMKQ
jgi:cation-transporting P-type ATPase D